MEDFDAFVTARGLALTRFAYLICGDRHLAEDLVQEVLARMHPRWPRVTKTGAPEPYVKRAIVRQLLAWRRRRSSQEQPSALPDGAAAQADHAVGIAERDVVWRALAGLPRQQRIVLVLRHYEDLSDAQIADVLGCARSTVRVHASRAAAALRGLLGSDPLVLARPGGVRDA